MMTITDRIKETIEEIANERKIDEHYVSWHNIAIRLAEKLNKVENLAIPDVVGRSEQLKCEHKGRRTATELVEYCEDCKKILYHP